MPTGPAREKLKLAHAEFAGKDPSNSSHWPSRRGNELGWNGSSRGQMANSGHRRPKMVQAARRTDLCDQCEGISKRKSSETEHIRNTSSATETSRETHPRVGQGTCFADASAIEPT